MPAYRIFAASAVLAFASTVLLADERPPVPPVAPPKVPGEPPTVFDAVVVTSPKSASPLEVETDPKAPRQPLPAHDGADFLRSIPGFALVRKGGTDGDPVFRGMAGSRLGIVVDGAQVLGGCGSRMDPPTAYVYPDAYDRATVLKGPQSVVHGAGHAAAIVLFERETPPPETALRGYGSLVGGSFGRNDQAVDTTVGLGKGFLRAIGTRSATDDYRDGTGAAVHSRYERWSGELDAGWRPSARHELVLSGGRSDGEAAYADRAMDGVAFDRRHVQLRTSYRGASVGLVELDTQFAFNDVDHVMDNFSLRPRVGMAMVSNPSRRTLGARLVSLLVDSAGDEWQVGTEYRSDRHDLRSTMNENATPYATLARIEDGRFADLGAFGEHTSRLSDAGQLVVGARVDGWRVHDRRERLRLAMGTVPNPTADQVRRRTLWSGFARYEFATQRVGSLSVGLGHAERFPDYWELLATDRQGAFGASAFMTRPERTTQLDVGLVKTTGAWYVSASAFLADHQDFVLIDRDWQPRPGVAVTRNIEAQSWGAEVATVWRRGVWSVDGTLAWVRGNNRTDNTAMAQVPPLEGRLGLTWDDGTWAIGSLLRLVDDQDRVDIGAGSIVGLDLGASEGFSVLALNGSWRARSGLTVAVGVDNLLDEAYAEHVSRPGAMIGGFLQTTRVLEPGRTLWVRASIKR